MSDEQDHEHQADPGDEGSAGTIRRTRFSSRFNPGDLDPRLIAEVKALGDDDREVRMLGTVIGKVTGLSYRNNPQDPSDPAKALMGMFEGVPADPSLAIIQSTLCYLPRTVHDLLVSEIAAIEEITGPATMPARGKPINHRVTHSVPIAFQIGVRHTSTPIAFEFVTEQLLQREQGGPEDALAGLRRFVGGATPSPQLEQPKRKKRISGRAAVTSGRALPPPKKKGGRR